MGDTTGFMKYGRELPTRRPIPVRVHDWQEVYEDFPPDKTRTQAARCMDCGIPFCHTGCPLGNLIPEWNDLVYRDHWQAAIERLHATNNFPEFTGRLCPAPCEAACVLGISEPAVTIKQVEVEIIDRAFEEGWVGAAAAVGAHRSARRRRRFGPGGARGRAAAHARRPRRRRLRARRSHRRSPALRHPRVQDGEAAPRPAARADDRPRAPSSAPVSTSASTSPSTSCSRATTRWCSPAARRRGATCRFPAASSRASIRRWSTCRSPTGCRKGDLEAPPITAEGKRVVIIGGGDTGADCLGTALRQGATSVHQFEILPRPPDLRDASTPWPTWPLMLRTSSAHEEGCERVFAVNTECFLGDDDGRGARCAPTRCARSWSKAGRRSRRSKAPTSSSSASWCCLAMGFLGPERAGCSTTSASRSTAAATSRATAASRRRCRTCSCAATWAAGRA